MSTSAPAYPTFSNISYCDEGGLTKRELFAAMAMQGHIAAGGRINVYEHAREWVRVADALLAALATE